MMGTDKPDFNSSARGTEYMTKTPVEGLTDEAPRKELSPAARRALAEAEARRRDYLEREKNLPREVGGRGGKDPARYGDWEIKGRSIDF